jgi:hypothetical protein
MTSLKKLSLIAVASIAMTLGSRAVLAEDAKPITGVLIDNMCGDKEANKSQDAAAKHKMGCAKKCEDSGFQVVMGDKHYKLDDAGNEKAKEYIKSDGATTMVTIEGKMADDKITDVTSIKAAEKKD